jgi:hypothetical protein
MPDTLEEFFNGDINLTQILAGHPIITNSAGQRAVLRDLTINGPPTPPIDLTIGGTTILSAGNIDRLTGTELVPPSSSLSLRSLVPAFFNRTLTRSGSDFQTGTNRTPFDTAGTGVAGTFNYAAQSSFSTALTTPADRIFMAGSDFYYGHFRGATARFRRRAGGMNGAETNLDAIGGLWAYDGQRFVYGIETGVNPPRVRTYDTQTDTMGAFVTMTGAAASFSASSTLGALAAIDGVLVYTETLTRWVAINPTTGATVALPVGAPASGDNAQGHHIALARNAQGQYILIRATDSGGATTVWDNFGTNLLAPQRLATGNVNGFAGSTTPSVQLLFTLPASPNLVSAWDSSLANFRLLDANTMSFSGANISASGTNRMISIAAIWPTFDLPAAIADFGNIRVRATGVRIT